MSNAYCCVPGCNSWKKRDPSLSFFLFPKQESKVKVKNKFNNFEFVSRRKVWTNSFKIGKRVSPFMKVCSLHFDDESFLKVTGERKSTRKFLKKNAVPTKNLPMAFEHQDPGPSVREQRLTIRNRVKDLSENPVESVCDEDIAEDNNFIAVEDIQAANTLLLLVNSDKKTSPKFCDFQVQVNTPEKLTLCSFINDDKSLSNLTGLNSHNILNSILSAIDLAFSEQRVHRLTIKERVILTLTKMKWNLSYSILAIFFGISVTSCKTYIIDMLHILSSVLKSAIVFSNMEEVQRNMPICFEKFMDTQIVLDCTEINIQTPKCLCCRIRFYSHYKGTYTIKFMTGVSPAGLITFISRPYGGRASDKLIFEQSNLIHKLEINSAIMVDKGFLVDNICTLHKIKIYRPPFLRGQKQLSATDAEFNAKIASARVHIERTNQRIKIFKILGGKLQWGLVPHVDKIFMIACAITNLSSPILASDKFVE